VEELLETSSEQSDPLHEKSFSPVKGIVHRYPTGYYLQLPRSVQIIADIVRVLILSDDLINLEGKILKKHLTTFPHIKKYVMFL